MEKNEKILLELMRKVALTTLDYVKGKSYLEKRSYDSNLDFRKGSDSNREFILNKIQEMEKEYKESSLEQFDMMYCLRADVKESMKLLDKQK